MALLKLSRIPTVAIVLPPLTAIVGCCTIFVSHSCSFLQDYLPLLVSSSLSQLIVPRVVHVVHVTMVVAVQVVI